MERRCSDCLRSDRKMLRERAVLHFNVADFAVAVERCRDSALRGKALIVAPLHAARSMVYDMSEEAYRSGVRKGMPLYQARRLCRGAELVPPQFEIYRRAMSDFLKEVRCFSPLVQHGDYDGHLFVDVTGTHRLFGPAPDIGWRVRREVKARLGINPIWTLSSNRLVAKVASRLVKPMGEYIVAAGEEEEFLAPLPVSLLPGIRPQELRKLRQFNLFQVGQIAALSREELFVPFGIRNEFFYQSSRGVEDKVVCGVSSREESLVFEHHFDDDTNDTRRIHAAFAAMAARAGLQLRARHCAARRAAVKIVYSDGSTVVRQFSRKRGSNDDTLLFDMAFQALQRARTRRTRLRSCYCTYDRVHRQSSQLALFSPPTGFGVRRTNLLSAMDEIRNRFGHNALQAGSTLFC